MKLELSPLKRSLIYLVVVIGLMWAFAPSLPRSQRAGAQDAAGPSAEPVPTGEPSAPETPTAPVRDEKAIDVLKLTLNGGIFMIPLFGLSLLTVTIAVERFIGLRRSKVLPNALVEELGALGSAQGGFDPRKAYKICQNYPSAASRVVRAMLLKVGRPLAEVEHTVKESSEREATRLYRNVRWLDLASSTSTLIGLLGTVQGMIMAFHQITVLEKGQDRSIALAEGIYVALVTTFAGLTVAIPAGALSHYFEGRIQNLFHEIDEMVFNLLPQVEKYEGRVRFSRQEDEAAAPQPPPAAPARAVAGGK